MPTSVLVSARYTGCRWRRSTSTWCRRRKYENLQRLVQALNLLGPPLAGRGGPGGMKIDGRLERLAVLYEAHPELAGGPDEAPA